MSMRRYRWLLSALLLGACGRGGEQASGALCAPELPASPYAYTDASAPLPAHFRGSIAGTVLRADNMPPANRTTNPGAALGRVLFYDPRLSSNDAVRCGSCHQQRFGFGDTARLSAGVHGHDGRRTLALANARFNAGGRFFWDERAASLEAQVLQPIEDPREMDMPLPVLETKLAAVPYYPALFAAAFGSPDVRRDRIAAALAQFVRSLVSSRSKFDSVFRAGGAPDFLRLSPQAREGYRLFNAKGCVNCHRSVTQFADKANNNGLDPIATDTGAGGGRFRPASLRNVAVRPPYMHDGRFATLEQVVEFYDHGVQPGPGLDPRLRGPDSTPRRLGLSGADVGALVAFLEALTDSTFLADPRFSDPFPCRR
jgi:cytochrome c peroxidase